MGERKRVLKDLKRFTCSKDHWAALIFLIAINLIPGILELLDHTKLGENMGKSSNGFLMSAIGIAVSIILVKLYDRWITGDFIKLINSFKDEGLLDILLRDYEKNKQVLFSNQLILGDTFIIKKQNFFGLLIIPYSSIETTYLKRTTDDSDKVVYYIYVTSSDKRYRCFDLPCVVCSKETAKADYDSFCNIIRQKNPNVHLND